MKNLVLPLSLLALAAGCSSPRTHVTQQDAQGNYITTSEYEAMTREQFHTSMQEGLADYRARMDDLRVRANELGGDALKEFSDYADALEKKRVKFENELQRSEAVLADQWPDQRERTLDAYYDLREELDEAWEEVLEEAD